LLNDKLRSDMELKASKKSGIWPDKLFRERSMSLMPLNSVKDWGIHPSSRFPSKWRHSPSVEGISPAGCWKDWGGKGWLTDQFPLVLLQRVGCKRGQELQRVWTE
jgi:hypothetical protein